MFGRLLRDSYLRRRRQKIVALCAVTLGTMTAVTLLNVAVEIGDRVNRELKSLGANIVAMPKVDAVPLQIGGIDLGLRADGGYLQESDIARIKTIFWRNNVIALAPELPVRVVLQGNRPVTLIGTWFGHPLPVESTAAFRTGAQELNPSWQVGGSWPQEGRPQALVGRALATALGCAPGERLTVRSEHWQETLLVTGILTAGGSEDRQILAPLSIAQTLANRPGVVKRIFVSALSDPEPDGSKGDVRQMSPEEYDRWYCSPYPSSIAHQIEEVVGGSTAKVIRRVSYSEGRILSKTGALLLIVTVAVLATAALAVASIMASALLARRNEIALFKTLGADHRLVALLLVAESAGVALLGALFGCLGGAVLSRLLGQLVLGHPADFRLVLVPVSLLLAVLVVLAGGWQPIRGALRANPVHVLQGN